MPHETFLPAFNTVAAYIKVRTQYYTAVLQHSLKRQCYGFCYGLNFENLHCF